MFENNLFLFKFLAFDYFIFCNINFCYVFKVFDSIKIIVGVLFLFSVFEIGLKEFKYFIMDCYTSRVVKIFI